MGEVLIQAATTLVGEASAEQFAQLALGAGLGLAQSQLNAGPDREGPRLTSLDVMSGQEGAPMARVYGRSRIAGQVIWSARLHEHVDTQGGGKGGGPQTRTYRYSLSFALGLCEGEIAGIGRIWANGDLLDQAGLNMRLYTGAPDQEADPLIEAIEQDVTGAVPAFRDTAYLVFEDLPLDRFGQRLPNLSVEVFHPLSRSGGMEAMIRGVNLIPGAGEFAYAPDRITRCLGPGHEVPENEHVATGQADVLTALDALARDLPACRSVQLVIAWFGTDLEAGLCQIRPGVENRQKQTAPRAWLVSGQTRANAHVVRQIDGRPAYGGSPDDASVIHLIRTLKARGYAVTLYPFILMDVDGFPWRGRIRASGPDVAAALDRFFGTVTADHVAARADGVHYSGPATWSYSRFILHLAALARAAGGVDGFLIGSEMVGLTTSRDADRFPAVAHLQRLAGEARRLLSPSCRLSYAADWTEYNGVQDGQGEKIFHLDPLWADPEIDAVAIDFYIPLADQRPGDAPPDRTALAEQVEAGEGYDWFYASEQDRIAGLRTVITDGADEAWIWRAKDVRAFWSELHHDRPGGVRSARPTAWQPRSKPIWLTEVGCPAVDRGANQPNVFYDPKSEESRLPWFSNGQRDDLIQRHYLEALLGYWSEPDRNPVSPVYGGPMLPPDLVHVWAYDARPWPVFPGREDIWSDGPNWALGHWLNGRAGLMPLSGLVEALAKTTDLDRVDTRAMDGVVAGYVLDRPMSARASLEPLVRLFDLDVVEQPEGLMFVGAPDKAEPWPDTLRVEAGGLQIRHGAPLDRPAALTVFYLDESRAYQPSGLTERSAEEASGEGRPSERRLAPVYRLAISADPGMARHWVRTALQMAQMRAVSVSGIWPGAIYQLEAGSDYQMDGDLLRTRSVTESGRVELVSRSPRAFVRHGPAPGPEPLPVRPSTPVILRLDLPDLDLSPRHGPVLAAFARPWLGSLPVHVGTEAEPRLELARPARLGRLLDAVPAGVPDRWDRGEAVRVQMIAGHLESHDDLSALSGVQRLAVGTPDTGWEVMDVAEARLVAPQTYEVARRVRGIGGSVPRAHSVGDWCVLLDPAIATLPLAAGERGQALSLRVGPVVQAWVDPAVDQALHLPRAVTLARLAAHRLRLSWSERFRGLEPDGLGEPPRREEVHWQVEANGPWEQRRWSVAGDELIIEDERLVDWTGQITLSLSVPDWPDGELPRLSASLAWPMRQTAQCLPLSGSG